jgi:hypothetical protein
MQFFGNLNGPRGQSRADERLSQGVYSASSLTAREPTVILVALLGFEPKNLRILSPAPLTNWARGPYGALGGIRIPNLRLRRPALYPLSYERIVWWRAWQDLNPQPPVP